MIYPLVWASKGNRVGFRRLSRNIMIRGVRILAPFSSPNITMHGVEFSTCFIFSQDITFRNSAGPDLIVRKRESQRPRQASKSKPPPLHSPSLHDRCLNQFSMSHFESSQCQTLLREFLARLCAEQ